MGFQTHFGEDRWGAIHADTQCKKEPTAGCQDPLEGSMDGGYLAQFEAEVQAQEGRKIEEQGVQRRT